MSEQDTILSEKALEVVQRLHDGELSEKDGALLDSLNSEETQLVNHELRTLGILRNELRAACDDAWAGRTKSTWMSIEKEASAIAEKYRQDAVAEKRASTGWATWRESAVVSRLIELFTPRVVAPAFALLAVLIVADRLNSSSVSPLTSGQSAVGERYAAVSLPQPQLDRFLRQIAELSFSVDRRPVLAVSSDTAQEYRKRHFLRDQNDLHVHFAASMIDRDFILGGLRTKGADIESISSERMVNLLPSEEDGTPPIVWVANAAPNFGVASRLPHQLPPADVN